MKVAWNPSQVKPASRAAFGGMLARVTGGGMASQPHSDMYPNSLGSPYCSDPNCKYCKELRDAQNQLAKSEAETANEQIREDNGAEAGNGQQQ